MVTSNKRILFFERNTASFVRVMALGRILLICFFLCGSEVLLIPSYAAQHKIFEKSFSATSCMAEFQGRIFVGVGNDTSAKIFRLTHSGCKIWEDVTPLWSANTTSRTMAMAVFNDALFVGTSEGEVWATLDGLKWYNVSGTLPSTSWISDMAVFNGYLYVSHSGITIYRSVDGLSWEPVVGPSPALHPTGFGNVKNFDLQSIETFNGFLYAGIGRDNINGIQIWRTADGIHWDLFHEMVQPVPLPPILEALPGHVHAMTVYNGKLFIGAFEGNEVFRTDGTKSPLSWDMLQDPSVPSHGIFELQGHGGKLYRGNFYRKNANWKGMPLLYESTDGNTWTAVAGSPVVTLTDDGAYALGALLSANNHLYSGTTSGSASSSVPSYKIQIYEMGDNALTCELSDVNQAISGLKERFKDIANLVSICNPPPPGTTPESICFLLVSGYGQSVIPDFPTFFTWVYSAIDEIQVALRDTVSPRNEPLILKKIALLDEINSEFRIAMALIFNAAWTVDTVGSAALKSDLDDAISRLEHAADLINTTFPWVLFLPAINGNQN